MINNEINIDGFNNKEINLEISNIQLNILKLEQSEYENLEISNKEKKIINLSERIKENRKKEDLNIINELRNLSKSKYGFLYMKYRRELYKFIIEYLSKKENITIKNINYNNESTFDNVIDKDSRRSILFSIIKNNSNLIELKNNLKEELFIEILKKYTNIIVNNIPNFQYYQGFHEITLYLLVLFGFNKESIILAIKFTILYFDFFISDNLDYPFLLDLLLNCSEEINKKSSLALTKIIQTKPYFSLSWAITWFLHDNKNILINYRIMDYLIMNNISSVYFLSSSMIIYEFNKLKEISENNNLDSGDIYIEEIFNHYQNIDYNKVDWEYLINNLSKMDVENKYKNALNKTLKQNEITPTPELIKSHSKKLYNIPKNKIYINKKYLYIILIIISIILSIRINKK